MAFTVMKKYTTFLKTVVKYIVYSNQGVVLTDLGITGESNRHGTQEFDKGKSIEANVMCNYRERNGDICAYLHFKKFEGEEDVRTNGFTILYLGQVDG